MAHFFIEYGLFLAKALTIVVSFLLIIAMVASLGSRKSAADKGHLEITLVNDKLADYTESLRDVILSKDELKAHQKILKKQEKADKKADVIPPKGKVYVLTFDGDIRASAVESLRKEITAILSVADAEHDEIVVCLESPGGMVHGYGLAASQLARIKNKKIPLTICVDKVAASGGYMMACIADKIIAAPFAIIGSIGVVAQIPNFNRLLEKSNIDVEILTAGEYKRTLTMFGKNTEVGRKKFQEELEDTHILFKDFVQMNRPVLDMAKVATGEHWFGQRALALQLVDELKTSDEYIVEKAELKSVFLVKYMVKHSLSERLGLAASAAIEKAGLRLWSRLQETKLP